MAEPAPNFGQLHQDVEDAQTGWTPHIVHDLPPGGLQAWEAPDTQTPTAEVVPITGRSQEVAQFAVHWTVSATSEDLAAYHRTRPTHYSPGYLHR